MKAQQGSELKEVLQKRKEKEPFRKMISHSESDDLPKVVWSVGRFLEKETDTKRGSKEEEEEEKIKRKILWKAFQGKRNRIPPTDNRFAYGNKRESENQENSIRCVGLASQTKKYPILTGNSFETWNSGDERQRKEILQTKKEIDPKLRILAMIRKRKEIPYREQEKRNKFGRP